MLIKINYKILYNKGLCTNKYQVQMSSSIDADTQQLRNAYEKSLGRCGIVFVYIKFMFRKLVVIKIIKFY